MVTGICRTARWRATKKTVYCSRVNLRVLLSLVKYFHSLVLLYILFCYYSWWCSFKPSCYECTRYRQCILVATYHFCFVLFFFVATLCVNKDVYIIGPGPVHVTHEIWLDWPTTFNRYGLTISNYRPTINSASWANGTTGKKLSVCVYDWLSTKWHKIRP